MLEAPSLAHGTAWHGCAGRGHPTTQGPSCLTLPYLLPSPVEKKDNTLTLIIVSVVGGVIGLLVLIMLIKKLVLFILKKTREK